MSCERFESGTRARLAAMALVLVAGCADLSRGEPPFDAGAADAAATSDAAAISFSADVYPLLSTSCGKCHLAGGQAGDTKLLLTGNATADAAVVKMFVDTITPTSSRLLAKASGNGHGGGTIYQTGSHEYETLLHWIQQGASP